MAEYIMSYIMHSKLLRRRVVLFSKLKDQVLSIIYIHYNKLKNHVINFASYVK